MGDSCQERWLEVKSAHIGTTIFAPHIFAANGHNHTTIISASLLSLAGDIYYLIHCSPEGFKRNAPTEAFVTASSPTEIPRNKIVSHWLSRFLDHRRNHACTSDLICRQRNPNSSSKAFIWCVVAQSQRSDRFNTYQATYRRPQYLATASANMLRLYFSVAGRLSMLTFRIRPLARRGCGARIIPASYMCYNSSAPLVYSVSSSLPCITYDMTDSQRTWPVVSVSQDAMKVSIHTCRPSQKTNHTWGHYRISFLPVYVGAILYMS